MNLLKRGLSERASRKIRSQQPHNEDLEANLNQFYTPLGQKGDIELKKIYRKKTNQQPDQEEESPEISDLRKSLLGN